MINLKFANAAEALSVLAAKGIAATNPQGVAMLPKTLSVNGVRVDIILLNSDGVLMLPTGEMQASGTLPDGTTAASIPVMAPSAEFYLSMVWSGENPPTFESIFIDDQTRNVINAPPVNLVPLADAKLAANQAILDFANSMTAKVTSRYPVGEVDSWPLQVIEARQVVAGSQLDPNAMLPAMARNANITLDAFAANVLVKAARNQNIVVTVQALRVQGETLLNSVTAAEQIPPILAQLKATALTQAHAMGLI